MVPVWRDGVIYLFCRGGFAAVSLKPSPWGEGAPVRTLGRMRGLPLKAFPLGGRWHGEAVTDEGAMIERFRFLAGRFRRLRAASDFLNDEKVTKESPGDAADGHFVPIGPLTPGPPFTGVTPWARQKSSGAQNLSGGSKFPSGHWALAFAKIETGAVPLVRLALPNKRYRYVLCRRGGSKTRPSRIWLYRRGGTLGRPLR